MPKLALFDMDDTLFEYSLKLTIDMIDLASPEELKSPIFKGIDDPYKGHQVLRNIIAEYSYLNRRAEVIKRIPGWWQNLPKHHAGWAIYRLATKVGFCVKILTKGPRSKSHVWAEKVECINEHFGIDMPIDIVGKDKAGTYGRVLVDDYPGYVSQWLEHRPRGLAILPKRPWNEEYRHPNAIIYDLRNYDEENERVQKAMQAAYDRESKQHWRELI